MLRTTFLALVGLIVVVGPTALADIEAVNEWNKDVLAHTLECHKTGDLKVSSLPGFVEVLISSKTIRQVRYLPVADIKDIDYYDYGVYITWRTEMMKNGSGYMATVVYVPKEVQSPDNVINILKEAMTIHTEPRITMLVLIATGGICLIWLLSSCLGVALGYKLRAWISGRVSREN